MRRSRSTRKNCVSRFCLSQLKSARKDSNADYNIFVDTIPEGRFEDTNKVFEKDDNYDYRVKNKNDKDAKIIAWSLGNASHVERQCT